MSTLLRVGLELLQEGRSLDVVGHPARVLQELGRAVTADQALGSVGRSVPTVASSERLPPCSPEASVMGAVIGLGHAGDAGRRRSAAGAALAGDVPEGRPTRPGYACPPAPRRWHPGGPPVMATSLWSAVENAVMVPFDLVVAADAVAVGRPARPRGHGQHQREHATSAPGWRAGGGGGVPSWHGSVLPFRRATGWAIASGVLQRARPRPGTDLTTVGSRGVPPPGTRWVIHKLR